jgi:hypothetical protein
MMNRDKPNLEKSQLGFLDYVIHPLYNLWVQVVGEETGGVCIQHIKTNRKHWEDQLKKQDTLG